MPKRKIAYLRELESYSTPDVKNALGTLSSGLLPLSGFSEVQAFFAAAGKLDIGSTDKTNAVYDILKSTAVSDLLSLLKGLVDSKKEKAAVQRNELESTSAKLDTDSSCVSLRFMP